MKIGIIGNGFVGKATMQLECNDVEIYAYDINPEMCKPKGTSLNDMLNCEIIFISVPTPMKENGECFLDIVQSVVNDLNKIQYKGCIVLRSTIPVGTTDSLNCFFMPEFLTEKNYLQDFINNKDWIFGLKNDAKQDEIFKDKITTLFSLAHKNKKITNNNIHFLMNKEAEMIKLFKNSFLATKISFCNEMYQFCQMHNITYENVRNLACNDERILHSHSYVPGHDGKKGYGGTCFPKDVASLIFEMEKINLTPHVLNSVKYRNDNIDRKEKDWETNKGRTIV